MAKGRKRKLFGIDAGGYGEDDELEGAVSPEISGGAATKAGAKKALLKSVSKPLSGGVDPLAWKPSSRSGEEVQLGKNIAGGLRSLSEEGNLTADLLKEARGRGLSGSAFDEEGFDSFLEKEGIGVSEEGAQDPYEAAQKVMGAKTGLDRLAAMQDPKYQLGSGSSLRKAPVELETRSGAMRRAGRALGRVGATTEANQMFGAAAAQKLGEPNIMTQEQRGRLAGQQQQAAGMMQETQEQARRYRDLSNKLMEQRLKGGMTEDEDEDEDKYKGVRKYRGLGPNPYSHLRKSPMNR